MSIFQDLSIIQDFSASLNQVGNSLKLFEFEAFSVLLLGMASFMICSSHLLSSTSEYEDINIWTPSLLKVQDFFVKYKSHVWY